MIDWESYGRDFHAAGPKQLKALQQTRFKSLASKMKDHWPAKVQHLALIAFGITVDNN